MGAEEIESAKQAATEPFGTPGSAEAPPTGNIDELKKFVLKNKSEGRVSAAEDEDEEAEEKKVELSPKDEEPSLGEEDDEKSDDQSDDILNTGESIDAMAEREDDDALSDDNDVDVAMDENSMADETSIDVPT